MDVIDDSSNVACMHRMRGLHRSVGPVQSKTQLYLSCLANLRQKLFTCSSRQGHARPSDSQCGMVHHYDWISPETETHRDYGIYFMLVDRTLFWAIVNYLQFNSLSRNKGKTRICQRKYVNTCNWHYYPICRTIWIVTIIKYVLIPQKKTIIKRKHNQSCHKLS